MGQSNGRGKSGEPLLAPTIPLGQGYMWESTITPSASSTDYVQIDGGDGSMWPAWAAAWYDQSGRIPIIINIAEDGTCVRELHTAGQGSSWNIDNATDSIYVTKRTALNAAYDRLAAYGITPASVTAVWNIGENDGRLIELAVQNQAEYEANFENTINQWNTDTNLTFPFTHTDIVGSGVINTTLAGGADMTDDVAMSQIRAGQAAVATAVSAEVYNDFAKNVLTGEQLIVDEIHWKQTNNNTIGHETSIFALAARGLKSKFYYGDILTSATVGFYESDLHTTAGYVKFTDSSTVGATQDVIGLHNLTSYDNNRLDSDTSKRPIFTVADDGAMAFANNTTQLQKVPISTTPISGSSELIMLVLAKTSDTTGLTGQNRLVTGYESGTDLMLLRNDQGDQTFTAYARDDDSDDIETGTYAQMAGFYGEYALYVVQLKDNRLNLIVNGTTIDTNTSVDDILIDLSNMCVGALNGAGTTPMDVKAFGVLKDDSQLSDITTYLMNKYGL